MALLEVENLVKVYSKRAVVDHVSYSVDAGEVVGLLGPNGAGKTTTFRMTVGMISRTEGKVVFGGQDVSALPMYQRARRGMGYLSQEPSIFRKLTVEQNILAVLQTMAFTRSERKRRCAAALEELELTKLATHKADTLSGGERRRLEITRALISNPSLMLLDEPFSGVDPIAVLDIQTIIKQLRARKIGVLLTDHSVRETLTICDRSYIINEGKVLTSGSSDKLVNDPIARKIYLGEMFRGDEFVHQREAVKAMAEQTGMNPEEALAELVAEAERDVVDRPGEHPHAELFDLDEIERELERLKQEHDKDREPK